ncbi:Replication factor A protein 1 [Coemansia spiralis]|uniref:Replication factor A protein 1 n=1 Tax=Coemansia spiralis TaxID=417178 RepID=A0A9W8GGS4_9FUNG|nr:Replication factor A protein 1 [Coemansia spiralis]
MLTMVTDRDLAVFRVLNLNRCFVSKTFHQACPVINIVALDAKILGPMSEVLQDPVKTLEALNMVAPEPVMAHTVLSMVVPEPAKTLGKTDPESIDASSEKESEFIDTSSEKESESIETSSLIDTETLYELALDPFKAAKKGAVEPVENGGIPFKTVEQISSERIGSTYSVECFFLEGTVVGIYSDSIAYPACRGSNCSYEVAEDSTTGLWLCNKCKGLWSVPRYLFEFSFDVSDDTGIIQLECNNRVGKMLIGTTAIDAYKLGCDDRLGLDWKTSAAKNKKYVFKCEAKSKRFGSIKHRVISVVYASSRDK